MLDIGRADTVEARPDRPWWFGSEGNDWAAACQTAVQAGLAGQDLAVQVDRRENGGCRVEPPDTVIDGREGLPVFWLGCQHSGGRVIYQELEVVAVSDRAGGLYQAQDRQVPGTGSASRRRRTRR
jgi:hypothetical protein